MPYTQKHRKRGSHAKRKRNISKKLKTSRDKRRKTIHGGYVAREYAVVELHRNLLDNNIGREMHLYEDPIFPYGSDNAANISYLVKKRTGEVDELIEVMKKGRKEKPHISKFIRFTYDDSDAPLLANAMKQIRQCKTGKKASATATTPAQATAPAQATTPAQATAPAQATTPATTMQPSNALITFFAPYGITDKTIIDDIGKTSNLTDVLSDLNKNGNYKTFAGLNKIFDTDYKNLIATGRVTEPQYNTILGHIGCMAESILSIINDNKYQAQKTVLFSRIYASAIYPKWDAIYNSYRKLASDRRPTNSPIDCSQNTLIACMNILVKYKKFAADGICRALPTE